MVKGGNGIKASNRVPTVNQKIGNQLLDLTTRRQGVYTAYFDRSGSTSATTTLATTSLLTPLLNSTGLLAVNDSMVIPIVSAGITEWTSRVMIQRVDCRIRFLNALSNGVVAGDSYNTLRAFLYVAGATYLATKSSVLLDTLQFPDTEDVAKVLFDETVPTTILAFDSTDDGAPSHEFRYFSVNVNTILDCVSTSSRTAWDTKAGDLLFAVISDSAVTPHPTVDWAFRVHYRVLRDQ
jgi:hypothetical protein